MRSIILVALLLVGCSSAPRVAESVVVVAGRPDGSKPGAPRFSREAALHAAERFAADGFAALDSSSKAKPRVLLLLQPASVQEATMVADLVVHVWFEKIKEVPTLRPEVACGFTICDRNGDAVLEVTSDFDGPGSLPDGDPRASDEIRSHVDFRLRSVQGLRESLKRSSAP